MLAKARISTRGALSMALLGLIAVLVLGMVPALGAPGAAQLGSPASAPPAGAPGAPGPVVSPYAPLPTHLQQLRMAPPPAHISLGKFHLNAPTPTSWGPSGTPPGWEALQPASPNAWGGGGGTGGSTAANWSNRFCAGLWPQFENYSGSSAQGAYASGCYGHDEPGIEFQSDLPGSGGNVSWNVTLPTDRSPTLNQSNLYSAIWFGMTMSDPFGWMDQCFLELQFYPDQTYYNPGPSSPNWTVNGAWVGAAVAWQIEAATGAEDPCYYEPLYLNGAPGPAFLNMTQGDNIHVTMTGYPSSTTGEQLSIIDTTTGQGSNLTMYNAAQGYAIDPAYSQNNYEASMQWTPGGEYPVSFAFETGHSGNPDWPENNSYGGCSGGPVSTPQDPGAPCPSYDPGQWANDTLTPWKIAAPTFFNAKSTSHPAQVAFTQPEGGIPLVDQTSNGVCNGIDGSAWCSYPFYSYYCGSHLFEFGGVDYTGVTTDFGKWTQFASNLQTLSYGGSFYPPTNFSIPSCGAASGTLSVGPSTGGGGSVYFLSKDYAAVGSVPSLLAGTYSLNAIPSAGESFSHWNTTGGASVATPTTPFTTLVLSGSGSVRAIFTLRPTLTAVTFKDVGSGFIGVDPGLLWIGNGSALATLTNGRSLPLAPGMYSVQAYPKPGWNFSYWSWTGGVSVTAAYFPYTQMIVSGHAIIGSLEAWYTRTTTNGTIELYSIGLGSASFGSLSVNSTSAFGYNFGVRAFHAGTYPITVTPGPGVIGWQILYGSPLLISNNAVATWGTLENGTAVLEVVFTSGAPVTFHVSPGRGGSIEAQGATGFTAVTAGTNQSLDLGTYGFAAVPAPGFAFSGWSTKDPSAIGFSTLAALTDTTILGPGEITANFVRTTSVTDLTFKVGPNSRAGSITYNLGATYLGGTALTKAASGQHLVVANPSAGFAFVGWKSTGKVAILPTPGTDLTVILLGAGSGTVTAVFTPTTAPLSFVIWNPHGSTVTTGTLTVGGVKMHTGDTVWLRPGTYTGTLVSPAPLSSWDPDGGLTVVSSTSTTVTVKVTTGGTIEADLT
jgi:hypothetical protein